MLGFIEYLENYNEQQLLDIILEAVDIDLSSVDGEWDSGRSNFYFNVPGDNCPESRRIYPGGRCYKVHIYGGDSVSIAFDRGGSYQDADAGAAFNAIRIILAAIGVYLEEKKPSKISWSAVSKSKANKVTGQMQNPDARASIYERWAKRHLFPDKYVPLNRDHWISREKYDNEYVSNGYPAIPQTINLQSSDREKTIVIKDLKEKAAAAREEIQRREIEAREREEQERERVRTERAQAAQQDPRHNPEGLKVDDLIYVLQNRQYVEEGTIGKITGFDFRPIDPYAEDRGYKLYVNFKQQVSDGSFRSDIFRLPVENVQKDTEERRSERERQRVAKLQELLADRRSNPNDIKVGDEVAYRSRRGDMNVFTGTVEDLNFKKEYGDYKLLVKINWDDSSKISMSHANIEFDNYVNLENVSKASVYKDKLASLISDRTANPNGIKVGDQVITFLASDPTHRHNGMVGKVREMMYQEGYNWSGTANDYKLLAFVDWDERSATSLGPNQNRAVDAKSLILNNSDVNNRIQAATRGHQVQQQVDRNRERHERRLRDDEELRRSQESGISSQTPEELERLVNHPSNPQKIRPGDFVKVVNHWRRGLRNKKGVVVGLYSYTYDRDIIYVKIKIHRSDRSATTLQISNVERDTSATAARIQNRQARRDSVSALSRGFNIGDRVKVTRGRYNQRTGRILNFRLTASDALSAIIVSDQGTTGVDGTHQPFPNFSVNVNFIESLQGTPTQPSNHGLPENNLTFSDYLRIVESFS
jgi:hypothetical protein